MSTKLICVTPNNNNKFYNMTDLGNGQFKVEYGRVGAAATTLTYPISDWNKKYNEKIKKGYVDITESLSKEIRKSELDIEDKDVKELISFLMSCAKQSIKTNYNISIDNISDIQINKVQDLIDWLKECVNTKTPYFIVNDKLKDIYTTIPRKMVDTRYYFMAQDYKDKNLLDLLQEEQKKLDTLKSQLDIHQKTQNSTKITLDSLGFTCNPATQEDRDLISKLTDFRVANQKIFKISNKETESNFNPDKLKTKLFYHGSRNENFLSIIQNGLKIRPTGIATTGSMFGDGIYFANKARKSIGYTSLKGSYWASGSSDKAYLAIFEVATGKEWEVLKNETYKYWMGNINEQKVKQQGCNSVFAQGGADLRNDEYIIYNSNQCTIRYLIEITNK